MSNEESKQAALARLIQVTSRKSAKVMTYTAAILGMAALFPHFQLPPELGVIASGIGVEAIGNLLDRIANNEGIADSEILQKVEQIIIESGIDRLLTKDDFYHAFAYLRKGQRALADQNKTILGLLARIERDSALKVSPAASDRFKGAQKKWREIERVNYPVVTTVEKWRGLFAGELALSLDETFSGKGYTCFNALLRETETIVSGNRITYFEFVCHQVEFCATLRRRCTSRIRAVLEAKQLEIDQQERIRQEMKRKEVQEKEAFAREWDAYYRIAFVPNYVALKLMFDPLAKRITIETIDQLSLDPADYPDKVTKTDELLQYLASLSHIYIGFFGDIPHWGEENYPLMKLVVDVLDHRAFDLNRVRINASNYDEWDYVNTDFDEEVRLRTSQS